MHILLILVTVTHAVPGAVIVALIAVMAIVATHHRDPRTRGDAYRVLRALLRWHHK